LFDFALFDSVISYETTPAAWARKGGRPAIISTRLVFTQRRLAERGNAFDSLWAAAEDPQVRGLPPGTGTAG